MGGNGGCGCGALGAEPCRCEHPARPPSSGAPSPGFGPALLPAPAAAPGTPEPYTRFDFFEEARRRGFPVAFPDDPARPPPPPARPKPSILEPAAHPAAEGRPIAEPRFDAPMPRAPADGPLAPEGAPLDIERFFDVASPEGAVVPFEAAWPGDVPASALAREGAQPSPRPEPLQPPEYLSSIGGPAEREILDAPPPEEPPPRERALPPEPPGFAGTDEPQGDDARAPGQAACTQDAHIVFPPAEQFLFTPQPPEARGGGGGGEEVFKGMYRVAFWTDPCPCKCVCVPVTSFLFAFVAATIGSLFDLFGKDRRSLLGVSAHPALVISTPDGVVEHVRDVVTRRDAVAYGTPSASAPGSAAPSEGIAATFAARAPVRATAQRLLWPELDGTLAGEVRVAPVGPGPGIPGIGAQPLVPASGSKLRAAPGSLFAGIAPAEDGFGAGFGGPSP